jgi:hypothetical protein
MSLLCHFEVAGGHDQGGMSRQGLLMRLQKVALMGNALLHGIDTACCRFECCQVMNSLLRRCHGCHGRSRVGFSAEMFSEPGAEGVLLVPVFEILFSVLSNSQSQ